MYPGQGLGQPVGHGTGLERPLAGVPGHQALAPVGRLGDHHGTVADAGHPQQGVLDLADLDPEATDLDLVVATAEELQLALRLPAAVVPAPAEPLTRAVRIGHEHLAGALGVVDVAAADTDPGEDDHAGGAQRHRGPLLVDDVDVHVDDRAAERDPFAVRHPVHDLVDGVVRGLGQPVGVDQLDLGLGGEPALHELLLHEVAGGRHRMQVRQLAGVLLQVGQDDVEVRRHDLEHAGLAVDDRVDEPLDVQDHLLGDQEGPATDQERGDELPHRDV
jgi:hypothetical protein